MSNLFDLGDLLGSQTITEDEPSTPEQEPDMREFTPSRYPKILLDKDGRPAAYRYDPYASPAHVQIDEQGIIWCGDEIVAHYSNTGMIRPAAEMPSEPTPAIISLIAEALILSNTYVFNDALHVAAATPEDTHHLRPLHSFPAFDAHMSASIAFVKIKTTKENVFFTVLPLEGRIALAVFASQSLKERLPKIMTQNEVSLPYHPQGNTKLVRWNPPGYNPENQVYTNNKAQAHPYQPKKVCKYKALLRWHRWLLHEFKWNTEDDYLAYLGQTLSAYCTDLLTKPTVNGERGARAMIPATLVESDATQGSSGKSALVKLSVLGPCGNVIGKVQPNKEEVTASMVSAVENGERTIYFDEAKESMVDALLTAISDKGGGRVKGVSREVFADLHVVLSASKPNYSAMLARRMLACKVQTAVDYKTRNFRRPIDKYTIGDYRAIMLTFCQALVERWASQGCPLAAPNSQWPQYSAMVGGILESCGVKNVLVNKIALNSYDDNDHIDSQWPSYFKLVADGDLTFGQDATETVEIEGTHAAADLLRWARMAGFYHQLKEDTWGQRKFITSLSSYLDANEPIYGYRLTKKRKNTGTHIIFERLVDNQPTLTTN